MSGGAFHYAYASTGAFAESLRERLSRQGQMLGSGRYFEDYEPTWTPQVAAELERIAGLAEHVAKLMREAEWLYSGDHSEESFLALVREHEARRNA